MRCPCEIHIDIPDDKAGLDLVRMAEQEARRIEAKFSRYVRGNVVDRINSSSGAPIELDEETAHLIDFANRCFSLSDGLFDITSGVLRRAWTFDGGENIPTGASVAALLPLVGWRKVKWDGHTIRMLPGMEIDLGGIGKEFAVDRALAQIRHASQAAVLVNFGGDVAAEGRHLNGKRWCIGIESADKDGAPVAVLELENGAVATSGDAKKFVMKNGKRYGHILDPRSGFPIENAARSVTVSAKTCSEAGFLSTLAILKGPDAEKFLDGIGTRYWCQRSP